MNSIFPWQRLIVLGVGGLLLCFWHAQSKALPLAGDAMCFVPAAQSLVRGTGWVNDMYRAPAPVDPEHPYRFVWHGVVAPAVWAATSRSDDFEDLRTAGVVVSSSGCLLFGLLILRATRDLRWPTSSVLATGGMLGLSGYFVHNGRPESVACVIVCMGLWMLPDENSRWWPIICGGFLGLTAATAPTSAMFLVPVVCIHQGVRCADVRQFCGRMAVCGAATVVTMFGVVALAGIEPGLWLEAMKLHSEKVMWERTDGEWATHWVKHSHLPLLVLTVAAQAACLYLGLHFWLKSPSRVRLTPFHKLMLFFTAVAFLWMLWALALKCAVARYNLLALLVVLAVVAASVSSACAGRSKILLVTLFCLSFVPGLIGLSREIAVWNAGKDHVLTLADARARLIQDIHERNGSPQVVCLHDRLFELSGRVDGDAIQFQPQFGYKTDLNVVVVPQTGSGLLAPPEVEGFQLAVNRFDSRPPRLFGMRLANTPGGYSYAVYLRDRNGW